MKNSLLMLLVLPLFVACGSWRNPIERISPHKIEIQQGNAITTEMLSKLKPGMTPNQVRFVLGTPLVVDPFRNDRWDYVYHLEKSGKIVDQRRISVIFENERLKGVEGDVVALSGAGAPKEESKP